MFEQVLILNIIYQEYFELPGQKAENKYPKLDLIAQKLINSYNELHFFRIDFPSLSNFKSFWKMKKCYNLNILSYASWILDLITQKFSTLFQEIFRNYLSKSNVWYFYLDHYSSRLKLGFKNNNLAFFWYFLIKFQFLWKSNNTT